MNAARGTGGDSVVPTPTLLPKFNAMQKRSERDLEKVEFALERLNEDKPFVDPLDFSDLGERLQARRLGLVRNARGMYVRPNEAKAEDEGNSGEQAGRVR